MEERRRREEQLQKQREEEEKIKMVKIFEENYSSESFSTIFSLNNNLISF